MQTRANPLVKYNMNQPALLSAALFIDGSNFYHSLKEMRRLPFDADGFQELFNLISQQYKLCSIYFYDAIKSSDKDPEGYSKQQKFHARLRKTDDKLVIRTRKLRYLVNITDAQIEHAGDKAGIPDSCKGKLKRFLIDLKVLKLTKEKGIDVQLVVDAVEEARAKKVEAVILLSGDADFVPAIQLINSYGLKTVNLHTYVGSSTELRNACNEHILIGFNEKGVFLK